MVPSNPGNLIIDTFIIDTNVQTRVYLHLRSLVRGSHLLILDLCVDVVFPLFFFCSQSVGSRWKSPLGCPPLRFLPACVARWKSVWPGGCLVMEKYGDIGPTVFFFFLPLEEGLPLFFTPLWKSQFTLKIPTYLFFSKGETAISAVTEEQAWG